MNANSKSPAYRNDLLRLAMLGQGFDEEGLSLAARVSKFVVKAVMKGSRHVSIDKLLRIAGVLDVNLAALFRKAEPADFEIIFSGGERRFRVVDERMPEFQVSGLPVGPPATAGGCDKSFAAAAARV